MIQPIVVQLLPALQAVVVLQLLPIVLLLIPLEMIQPIVVQLLPALQAVVLLAVVLVVDHLPQEAQAYCKEMQRMLQEDLLVLREHLTL